MTAILIVRSIVREPLQTDEKKASRTVGPIAHEATGLLFEMTTITATAVMQTSAIKVSNIAGHGA
jgi:hypothetical protein